MANERMKNGLRLLELALSATQNGVMITDATSPDEPIVFVNRAFERITSYASEEVLGRNPRFLQAGDSDQPAFDDLRKIHKARNDDVEWTGVMRSYRKDGTPFWNELSVSPVRDEGGSVTHFVGVMNDATKRREVEEALRKSEANLAQAQRLACLGSWESSWSDEAYRVLGFAPREFAPTFKRFFGAVHPDDRGLLKDKMDAALRGGEPLDLEHRLVRPDGEVRVVHCRGEVAFGEGGEPLRMVGTVHDVTERKEAEEDLKESEGRFRALTDAALEGILITERGTILEANRAYAEMFGYELSEMVGRPVLDFTAPESVETVLQHTRSGNEDPYEVVAYKKDGTRLYIEIHDRASTYRGRDVRVTAIRDVTERRLSEKALRESEARFRWVAENLGEGLLITDVADVVLYANPRVAEMTGYAVEEILGHPAYELLLPPERWPEMIRRNKQRAEGATGRYEIRLKRKDQTSFWAEVNATPYRDAAGAILGTLGAIADVSEHKLAEEALKESERRFRQLFDQSVDALLVHNEEGRMVDCNAEACRSLGYTREELLSLSVKDFATNLLSDEEKTRVESGSLWQRAASREPGTGMEGIHLGYHRRKDGSVFPVEVRVGSVDYGGERMIFASARDVTERKRIEEALRESEERYRAVVEQTAEGIYLLDVETRCVVEANAAFAELLGYAPEELPGMTAYGFVTQAPEELEDNIRRTLEERRRFVGERRYRRKDGSSVNVEANVSIIHYGGRDVICAAVRDVTERVRAEEALRESEERFRSLFEQAADAVFVHDLDGGLVDVNRRACESLGYAREELLSLSVLDVEQDLEPGGFTGLWERAVSGGPVTVEGVHRRKGGTTFPVEVRVGLFEAGRRRLMLAVARDVTERKEAEEALRESHGLLRAVMEGTTDAVFVKDLEGRYLMINRAGAEVIGSTAEEVLGKTDAELFAAGDGREVIESDRAVLASGETRTTEDTKTTEEGATRTFLATKGPYTDAEGEVVGLFGVSRDITERKELEERLEHQAFHDPLTGLPNRALLMDRLGHALARARRPGGAVAVLFLDLDNFKYVNDSLGHDAGDELLAAAARRLEGCIRPGDTVARLGGDEFAVVLEGARDAVEARRIAERAVEALGEPFDLEGREVFCGTSVGVALGEAGWDHPEDLLRKADLALYEAKREGKARHAVFDPETERRSMRRLELENGLRRAVERDEIVVRYQPVVALKTGRTVGFEALVRWQHPERGLVPPNEFVPLAEETGLIIPVGERVLLEACRQTKAWQESHPSDPPLVVGVNLSARQLSHPNLVGDVEGILEETGIDPGRLTLEVTESVLVEDAGRHASALRGLRGLGVRFAIDDFGTGYSSLSYLRRLPAGLLKLDGSFVEGIGEGAEEDEVLLRGVVGIAHGLGLSVVAEGVETAEQATRLRELGCDLAQGNHFSRPLTVEAASQHLAGVVREGKRPT